MKRGLMGCTILVCLLGSLWIVSPLLADELKREREQEGIGKSLFGLQEGVREAVGGVFGVVEHTAKFLFYGTRDGLRSMGREAKKTDGWIQKRLW